MTRSPALVVVISGLVVLSGCLGWGGGTTEPAKDDGDEAGGRSFENSSVGVRDGAEVWSDSRPHTHDYWNGRETVVIADRTLDFGDADNRLGNEVTFLPDPGKSVLPGTAEVRLTLAWEGEADVSARYFFPGPWRVLADHEPMGNGETWRIPVNRSGWDVPHATRSLWGFTVRRFAVDFGTPIEATVTIHRSNRSLPLDPPHFDQFADKNRKVLYDETIRASDWTAPTRRSEGEPLMVFPRFGEAMEAVPPSTARLVFDVDWRSDPTGDAGYRLSYLAARDTTDDRDATAETRGAEGAEWVLTPTDEQTDSPYAYHSRWEFRLWRFDGVEGWVPEGRSTFDVTVVAHRQP